MQTYIITGAAGHLGSTIIRELAQQKCRVRGLILPSETARMQANVTYYTGDVCIPRTLEPLFAGIDGGETTVIHTAGIVDISGEETPAMYEVNVNGTKNILNMCRKYGVRRLVHVSSVHAIPADPSSRVLTEISHFSPQKVVGGYAKTKAAATQAVLDAAAEGLSAVVVHPSGILGPYSDSGNYLVQLVSDYLDGRLPACVRGGYDFVDVRDVAKGCLAAAREGRAGECYILSNRHYEVGEILEMVRKVGGGRRLPVLPMWMARAATPLLGWHARRKKEKPLYTKYSLDTLNSNDRFSHDKATMELKYRPRDLWDTVRDTVRWLRRRAAQPA